MDFFQLIEGENACIYVCKYEHMYLYAYIHITGLHVCMYTYTHTHIYIVQFVSLHCPP